MKKAQIIFTTRSEKGKKISEKELLKAKKALEKINKN